MDYAAKFKKWLPLAGAVFALWLGLYFWAWLSRSSCDTPIGECLVTALAGWGADVVMLQWVKSYQGLLGGVLASVAGASVLAAAIYQRRMAVDDSRIEKQSSSIQTFHALRNQFHRLILARVAGSRTNAHAAAESIQLLIPAVVPINHLIADWLVYCLTDIKAHIDVSPSPIVEPITQSVTFSPDYVIGVGTVAKVYLSDPERLFDEAGKFRHVQAIIGDSELTMLDRANVKLEDLQVASRMVVRKI